MKQFRGHRIVCCHQDKLEPYLVCRGLIPEFSHQGGHPYDPKNRGRSWSYYTYDLCGNLMHQSCINRYGPCHEGASLLEYTREMQEYYLNQSVPHA